MASDGPADRAFRRVLWLGGAQWAGKTTVANLLAARHPLIHYAYDYHDARSHAARARAEPKRYPRHSGWLAALERDPDDVWVRPTPAEMAASARATFTERFQMVLDDLRAIPLDAPVLAEGWGLRPELVAPRLHSSRQAIFLVPTDTFRQHQLLTLPRAGQFSAPGVSDRERAQRNRIERDRLLAEEVMNSARRLGLRVVMVDGTQGVDGLLAQVEEQFRPLLEDWLY